jgi:hypothetical protein
MNVPPAPDVGDIHSAMEAHRRFLAFVVGTLESLYTERRGGETPERIAAVAEAIESERRFAEFVLCWSDAHVVAIKRLIDEVKTDRFAITAVLGALNKQGMWNRDQLQADYLEMSEKLWGAPENVPEHARNVAWLIGGDAVANQPPGTAH